MFVTQTATAYQLSVTKTPRLLILGGGAVISEYYIPALYAMGYAEQAVIVDASASCVQLLKQKYPQMTVYQADFRQFIENLPEKDKFDAAIIALPNWLHEEATAKALNCGLHVLCEKPLALTRTACLELANHAEAVNRILAVGMVRRLLPSVSALHEALKQELIGKLIKIDIEDGSSYGWLSDSGAFFRPENGGVLADMGIHYLDIVEHLVGELTPVAYQDDYAGGVEANVEFHLRTISNIPVRVALSRTRSLRNTVVFQGEQGELILEKETFDACLWRSFASKLTARLQSTQPFLEDRPLTFESCFAEQFFQFVHAIQGNSTAYISATEAASAVRLIEWAYQHRNPYKQKHYPVLSSSFHCPEYSEPDITEISKRPKLSPAPVVVTGGTGFIGTNLVERLYELDFEQIAVPVRGYRTCAPVARFPVKLPLIDLLDYKQVKTSLTGTRYVFHLAYGRDGNKTSAITIEGTKNVVEAAIEAGVESVVILSTMYVFGHPNTTVPVNETWSYAPTGNEYGWTKAQMEQWCLKRAESSKSTRIVVLNPSCVYGPGGQTYTQMPVEMARQGIFCWVEGGKGIANYTFVNNLIDAMLLAANCSEANGERFLINDGTTTWREFISPLLGLLAEQPSYSKKQLQVFQNQLPHPTLIDVLKVIATEPRVMDTIRQTSLFQSVKPITEKLAPKFMQKARKQFKQSTPLTPVKENTNLLIPPAWLADLFSPTTTIFSSEKAQRILGWQPLVSLEQGQKITTAWLEYINLF